MITKELQIRFNNILIVFLCFGLLSCNENNKLNDTSLIKIKQQKRVDKKDLKLLPNKGLVYFHNEPFSGISEAYYANDVLAETISYLDGKKHGTYKKWFESGVLSFDAFYSKGKQNGTTKSWWRSGILRSETVYENGIVNGIQKQWYKSGAKFKELNIVNGKEVGLQKAWRENGKIYNNYEAKNGRIFGLKRGNLCYQLEDEKVQYK